MIGPYVVLGLVAGVMSGLVGIGGGIVIVPVLVLLLGFSQHQAQGTALAMMVPPVGLLAAWTYYKQGFVDLEVAAVLCLGFLVGGLLGAKLATNFSSEVLGKVFGVVLLVVSLKMIFGR